MKVRFIAQAPGQFTGELRFAVIVCRHKEKWVYCQHRQRESFEIPGGHIEPGESPEQAAHRELYEETGALDYTLQPKLLEWVQQFLLKQTIPE